MKPNQYLKNQEYLPEFVSDFHDQKDLFKAIYDQYREGNQKKLLEDVNWVDAHVFTIDVFLWWMGEHGYKLQKIRKKGIEFYDPEQTIEHFRNIRMGKGLKLINLDNN